MRQQKCDGCRLLFPFEDVFKVRTGRFLCQGCIEESGENGAPVTEENPVGDEEDVDPRAHGSCSRPLDADDVEDDDDSDEDDEDGGEEDEYEEDEYEEDDDDDSDDDYSNEEEDE